MIRRAFLKGALASAAFVLFGNRGAHGQGWSGYDFCTASRAATR